MDTDGSLDPRPRMNGSEHDNREIGNEVPDTDLALLDRVLRGDSRAFDDLVRLHQWRVYRTTMAVTGNSEDAEEAMQDTFLKAYQHCAEFRKESRFSTWLTRIAVNEALQIRRRKRDSVSLDDPEAPVTLPYPKRLEDWYRDPEQRFLAREIRAFAEQAVRSLAPAYRVAFVLRDLEELSTAEAAEILGLTIPAMKTRLLRARLLVREALAAHFERPASLNTRLLRTSMMVREAIGKRLSDAGRAKQEE